MAFDKTTLPTHCTPKSVAGLVGKTITAGSAYKHGVVTVVELAFSDSSVGFIKVGHAGALEIGGTAEMGTGTKVSW